MEANTFAIMRWTMTNSNELNNKVRGNMTKCGEIRGENTYSEKVQIHVVCFGSFELDFWNFNLY